MIVDGDKLRNSALSGLLFLSVFHTLSQAMSGQIVLSVLFLCCAALFIRSCLLSSKQNQTTHPALLPIACSILWLTISYLYANEAINQHSLLYVWLYPMALANHILVSTRLSNALSATALAISSYLLAKSSNSAELLYQALPFLVFLILLNIISAHLKHLKRLLKHANTTDTLTGCVNPEYFKQHIEQAVELHNRYQTQATCLIFDLDAHFNKYIERENWLKEVAQVCQSRVRQSDILCRNSDQRFLVLLPNTPEENAAKLAADLKQACEVYQFSCLTVATQKRPQFTYKLSTIQSQQSWESWFEQITK